ncbi:MAG: hypothetical protein Q8P67_02665, partial [archaeon]|nr:hypothetical protein [archaeon]
MASSHHAVEDRLDWLEDQNRRLSSAVQILKQAAGASVARQVDQVFSSSSSSSRSPSSVAIAAVTAVEHVGLGAGALPAATASEC